MKVSLWYSYRQHVNIVIDAKDVDEARELADNLWADGEMGAHGDYETVAIELFDTEILPDDEEASA